MEPSVWAYLFILTSISTSKALGALVLATNPVAL